MSNNNNALNLNVNNLKNIHDQRQETNFVLTAFVLGEARRYRIELNNHCLELAQTKESSMISGIAAILNRLNPFNKSGNNIVGTSKNTNVSSTETLERTTKNISLMIEDATDRSSRLTDATPTNNNIGRNEQETR
ncbi:MAG: hypothetical protein LBJ93_02105 [Clostridiales bacterium]|jgi:hypothetical protein|nr:hypothetical protein [Clostridiales bacterium]